MTARKRASTKDMAGSLAAAKKKVRELAEEDTPRARGKLTVDIGADLLHELRVMSLDLPPRAIGGSLSSLVANAVKERLQELRDQYNGGKPFETDEPVVVRRGRPPRMP